MDELSKKFLIGLTLTLALIVILPIYAVRETRRHSSAQERFTRIAVERGAEVYATTCATCHGIQGGGKLESPGFIGFPLNPEFRQKASFVVKLKEGDSYVIDEEVARKTIHRGRQGGDPTNSLSPEAKKLTKLGANMPAWGLEDGGPLKDFPIENLVTLTQHWDQEKVQEHIEKLPADALTGLRRLAELGQQR